MCCKNLIPTHLAQRFCPDRVINCMMDIYAQAGTLEETIGFFQISGKSNVIVYNVMIKAYGNHNRPEQAVELLHELLYVARTTKRGPLPNITTFNSVLEALAKSSYSPSSFRCNKVEQANAVMRLIQSEEVQELGIRADAFTYTTLIKCAARSSSADFQDLEHQSSAQYAKDMLSDMAHHSIQPNAVTYTVVIEACLACDDLTLAQTIIGQMEASATPPNIVTYNVILNYWAKISSKDAAERAEALLNHLKEKSLSAANQAAKPDVVSYCTVMKAWSLSGEPDAADRIWNVAQAMVRDGVALNEYAYTGLITFFAQSHDARFVERASDLLEEMEKRFTPNQRLYDNVAAGWESVDQPDRAVHTSPPSNNLV
jgi:pentatricopeptide repeat protein